ncbi:hypothetical protein RJ55_02093 [Drechmeria coniospora]|nr:hypothetical protein RJ55_02093 [Drechmeria coniospora]
MAIGFPLLLLVVLASVAAAVVHPPVHPPTSLPPPPPLPPVASTAAAKVSRPAPPAPPAVSGAPTGRPSCECGYTYCASVLLGMRTPWNPKQLSDAYCKTAGAVCSNGAPGSDVETALYLCLCDNADQRAGDRLHLLCGCDECLVEPPDYRGRCATPCHAGACK